MSPSAATSETSSPAVEVHGLVKRFGDAVALDDLDLAVERGTVLGLLGPNGAGKTTTVRILSTLLAADAGRAEVAGFDVGTAGAEVRSILGLTGQFAAVDEALTGRENLELFGRLRGLDRAAARSRATELLDRFDLAEDGDRRAKTYSGGMRRRLDLAASLVVEPEVLVLDEPTTGLDPRSRLALWAIVRDLRDRGITVLLTTQYLEEADQLADRIVVIDRGKVIAEGTASELKAAVGGTALEVVVADPAVLDQAVSVVSGIVEHPVHVDPEGARLSVPVDDGIAVLSAVLPLLHGAGIDVVDIGLRTPTLDDVFLTLTGGPGEPAPEEP